jgi:hypothetical protein
MTTNKITKTAAETLHWMIRQVLKRPSPFCDRNDTQLHTYTKTIDTINGKSTPGVPSEGKSRKTNILNTKGHDVGRKYGLPPNDRTGTNYNISDEHTTHDDEHEEHKTKNHQPQRWNNQNDLRR